MRSAPALEERGEGFRKIRGPFQRDRNDPDLGEYKRNIGIMWPSFRNPLNKESS